MQPLAQLGLAPLSSARTATRFARRTVHFKGRRPFGAKHRSGLIAIDAPSQGVPCTFSANPIRLWLSGSYTEMETARCWVECARRSCRTLREGQFKVGRAPSHTAPHEASLREDADLEVRTTTEIPRPKCNNFP